jgi:hypothetical protein
MEQDEMWQRVIYRLLEYFDSMEGTTYLYDKGGRDNFVSETDSAIRNKVNDVFNKYHSDQRNSRI